MKVAVGSDHRGFTLKQQILQIIAEGGNMVQDYGAYGTVAVDYPDIARKVAEAVTKGGFDRAILICDTGIGMSIAANKVKGARAALCYDAFCAYRARLHNDANIVVLSANHTPNELRQILESFLNTEFEGGRHQRRLDKVRAIES